MMATKDSLLDNCRPSDISWDEFMLNCEEAINTADLHSDEISSADETLAKEERDSKKRPERILNTNSVTTELIYLNLTKMKMKTMTKMTITTTTMD